MYTGELELKCNTAQDNVSVYMCVYARVYKHVYVCKCVYINICMYICVFFVILPTHTQTYTTQMFCGAGNF